MDQFDKPLIDLENLTRGDAQHFCDSTEISWEKTLLFRQIELDGEIYSFVLATDCSVIVRRSAKKLLEEFTSAVPVYQFNMCAYSKFLGLKGSYHCVSGKYQLIASRGVKSADATWIMAHHIANYNYSKAERVMHITFKNHQTVTLDMSEASLKKRLYEANLIGATQIMHDRQFSILHGSYSEVAKQWGHFNLDESSHYVAGHDIAAFTVFKLRLLFEIISEKLYGVKMDDSFDQVMERILTQPFQGYN